MTLSAVEFIRRFSWHILPAGLVRIRHYGLLGNNRRHRDIPKARALLQRTPAAPAAPPTSTSPASVAPDPAPVPAPASAATPPASLATTPPGPVSATEPGRCPYCGGTALRWIGFIDARGRAHFPVAARLDSS
jgi:hypothetical protein